jgi:hypothetical protein
VAAWEAGMVVEMERVAAVGEAKARAEEVRAVAARGRAAAVLAVVEEAMAAEERAVEGWATRDGPLAARYLEVPCTVNRVSASLLTYGTLCTHQLYEALPTLRHRSLAHRLAQLPHRMRHQQEERRDGRCLVQRCQRCGLMSGWTRRPMQAAG